MTNAENAGQQSDFVRYAELSLPLDSGLRRNDDCENSWVMNFGKANNWQQPRTGG
jgi:hypothetical protein